MNQGRRKAGNLFTVACLLFILVTILAVEAAMAAEKLQIAPVNPEFTRYLSEKKAGTSGVKFTKDGHALGLVPDSIDRSYLRASAEKELASATKLGVLPPSLPSSYDLRVSMKGKIGPIRDQSMCGGCWSFATMASLESSLPKGGDLSENDLLDSNGFDGSACGGGYYSMAVAYLTRWSGPFPENQYPYQYLSATSPLQANTAAKSAMVHVQDVLLVSTTPDSVKTAVKNNGAVGIGFYWDDIYYNSSASSYYNSFGNTGNGGGHAVAVIGWDDNYPASNFMSTPPGNGAYLVRNSWGSGWGQNGYFWMSYYDASLDPASYYFKGETSKNYTRIYQYDPLGYTVGLGFTGVSDAWMANVFKADQQSPKIKAVSFYVTDLSASYDIYIYDNVYTYTDGSTGYPAAAATDGYPVAHQTGVASAGYHTIKLTTPASVTIGTNFSVVVHLSDNNGYNYPIAMEMPFNGYSSRAESLPGQSYVSSNGSDWMDLYGVFVNSNVCLKAFGGK